jgi:radical SAM/Cys-rich protein
MALPTLLNTRSPLAAPSAQRARLEALPLARTFEQAAAAAGHAPLTRAAARVLQVNLGKRCNQACHHCHVDAGPDRTEVMSDQVLDDVLAVLETSNIPTLDITGGAPELHPGFRQLVRDARALGVHVIDRCNLTVLFEDGQHELACFLAAEGVEVVASLPCYQLDNVDRQRGDGVFDKSIAALQQLNALGYGVPGSGLQLSLVYNPQGPSLPPPQARLEADYRRELGERFGIVFTRLLALTNMPIQRFGSTLVTKGQFHGYMDLLRENFVAANLQGVMCRTLLSVDWQGYLYDCDFNQQLQIPLAYRARAHLRDLLHEDPEGLDIQVADHCFGCTAGQGSSCGGALESA